MIKGNYANIKYFCISNGDGIGTSVFLSGCYFQCRGCQNKSIWNHKCGAELTDKKIDEIVDSLDNKHINHLSILGGEPLDDVNKYSTYRIIRKYKSKKYSNEKKLWIWSGYTWEILKERSLNDSIIEYIINNSDFIVDGKFEEDKKNLDLKYYGSSNQRVIDVKKSLREGNVVTYEK